VNPSYARRRSDSRVHAGLETPFDWIDQALSHPKIFVIGANGSGKRQYLASLPYARINWDIREDIVGVVPAGADTVAQMANALYYPGDISDEDRRGTYNVIVRPRTVRGEGVLGDKPVTLADLPALVFREPGSTSLRIDATIWHDNGLTRVAHETLPIQEHVATAIGLIFIIDPFVPPDANAFVADVLEATENVHAEWREAGVSSLPSADRPVPVAVIATKIDALHPGDPRLDDVVRLRDLIGQGQADRVNATDFRVQCTGVSAWGEGPGVRHAGTRFEPTDVLHPIRELLRNLPRLAGMSVFDIAGSSE
jgi:hypothetical protein